MEIARREIRSFVIRAARLSPGQKRCLEEYYPLYGVPFPEPALDWKAIFPGFDRIVIEIGFGNGEATVEIAQKMPQTAFLGIEVHPPGVGQVLREIHDQKLNNLRLLRHDAVPVIRSLPDACVDGFHVFFPDPWQKKKHHKRRLLQRPFLEDLARVLKPGGYFYFASDWEEYAVEVLETLGQMPQWHNCYQDWAQGIAWRPQTKFENRGLVEKRPIREVYFEKRS